MTENNTIKDPSINVRELVSLEVKRLDDLREREVKRIDEKILTSDVKNQIQFNAAKESVSIALIAAEKAVAAALDGTREAINKADITTDKRFDLLSEKIDGVMSSINKSSGERENYVTQTTLNSSLNKLQDNIEETLKPLVSFMNSQTGKGMGMEKMYGWIFGGIVLLITLANFIINNSK